MKSYLLQQDAGMSITRKDIASERLRLRKEQLDSLFPTQALFVALEEYNKDEEGPSLCIHLSPYYILTPQEVDYLFFAHHPGSIELLVDNYDVMMIDGTYSTSKYNTSLAHITGRDNLKKYIVLQVRTPEPLQWEIGQLFHGVLDTVEWNDELGPWQWRVGRLGC